MKAVRLALLVVVLATVAGCGDDDSPSSTTTTAPPPTTTSVVPTTAPPTATTVAGAASNCAQVAAKAVELAEDARATMRGIAGPSPADEARLQAEARALLAEARRLGCPIPPGVEQYAEG